MTGILLNCSGRYIIYVFSGVASTNNLTITMKKAVKKAINEATEPDSLAKASRGRPRQFDRAAALEAALDVFLEHGYEGTSVSALVSAMNIAPPSLYAAFGSKEALYRETLAVFLAGRGRFVTRALEEETTAEGLVRRILRDAAKLFTPAGDIPGCMVSASMVACGPESLAVADHLKELRKAPMAAIVQRLDQARKDGQLPRTVNAKSLAQFYAAVLSGMAVQARDGATRGELLELAENAMRAWPKAAVK
jgi:AcrR family transcriptional regulator